MGLSERRAAFVVVLVIVIGSPRIARAQSGSASAPEQVPGSVLLHIESPDPVDLQRETGDRRDPFYVACTSPCDEWVPATGRYRIIGGGTRASRRFELLASSGRETVVVSPASSTGFGVGIAGIAIGAAALGIGVLGLLLSALPSDDPNGPTSNGPPTWELGLIAGGLVAAAGGVTLVVLNASSHVHQTTAAGPSLRSWSGFSASDGARREAAVPRYAPAVSWPLLRIAF
ncbi:MAG TPA: hypothetical protein VE987_15030 [Polyangiaceae bacterium]|nr:hypothetical protein [Polyangiaceae bacterium]